MLLDLSIFAFNFIAQRFPQDDSTLPQIQPQFPTWKLFLCLNVTIQYRQKTSVLVAFLILSLSLIGFISVCGLLAKFL